jgi:hypothetical protein
MIQLTPGELRSFIFHFGTSSWGGTRKPPLKKIGFKEEEGERGEKT